MMRRRGSSMTIRAYRLTSNGQRIEVSRLDVEAAIPDDMPFFLTWPRCECPRHRAEADQRDAG